MSRELFPGSYQIVSLIDGDRPVGVYPILPASQPVRIGAPVDQWMLKKVGESIILLGVGGYPYTSAPDRKVIASVYPDGPQEWIATYREAQDAFTIAQGRNPSMGWTVPPEGGDTQILILPLTPEFLRYQLFKFVPLDE